jgi:capsule biosynthesis phosphatase
LVNNPDKTIVFDIDDTLTLGKGEQRGDEPPNLPLIEEMRRLHSEGWRIVLHTARGWAREGSVGEIHFDVIQEVETFCEKNNVPWDAIYPGKPAAKYYVDDRGMHWREFLAKAQVGEL